MAERVTAATVNARIDHEVLPAIDQLGEKLTREIRANSLNGMKPVLEQIVSERKISEDRNHKRREAIDWIANDLLGWVPRPNRFGFLLKLVAFVSTLGWAVMAVVNVWGLVAPHIHPHH